MVGGGRWWWVAGSNETKANSAQFQVKLPTGAELGNTLRLRKIKEDCKIMMYML